MCRGQEDLVIYIKLYITMRFVSILLLVSFGKDKGIICGLGDIGHCFQEVMCCRNLIWDSGDDGVQVDWVLTHVDVEW